MPQENVLEMPLRITFPHLVREPQKLLQRSLGDSQGPADTFGWDTVFAIRASDMNTTLAKPGSSPASFSQNENSTWYGSGNFGPWQVTLGGGAQNLHMSIPITSGSMFYNGDTYPMINVTATIEVALEYIPQPSSANGTPNNLVTNSQVVSVTDLDFTSNPPPPSAKWMMLGISAIGSMRICPKSPMSSPQST